MLLDTDPAMSVTFAKRLITARPFVCLVAILACDRATPPSPPLFSRLDSNELAAVTTVAETTANLKAAELEIVAAMHDYTDSVAPADRQLLMDKLLSMTSADLRAFIAAPDNQFVLNTALLPPAGVTASMTWNVPGMPAVPLEIEQLEPIGGRKIFRGYSSDSSVTLTMYQDTVNCRAATLSDIKHQVRVWDLRQHRLYRRLFTVYAGGGAHSPQGLGRHTACDETAGRHQLVIDHGCQLELCTP
jgi:hypothetical protein